MGNLTAKQVGAAEKERKAGSPLLSAQTQGREGLTGQPWPRVQGFLEPVPLIGERQRTSQASKSSAEYAGGGQVPERVAINITVQARPV